MSLSNRPGVNWDGQKTHFSVWSPGAEKVEICLFDPLDFDLEVARYTLTAAAGLWSTSLEDAPPGTPYGYRASGPYDPAAGDRFNPAKLLLDPCARSICGKLVWSPALFGYPPGDPDSDEPSSCDSAACVPRSIVVDSSFDWQEIEQPRTPLDQTIIYEAHVKGLTCLHPDVPTKLRGTYAGAAHPSVIGYLKELGITAIEFLPIHSHVDESFLVERGLTNYWGYNTIGFFSPDARYASSTGPGGEVNEFKAMVREYHKAGIEVILDVVYNHTAEANQEGPTLSFRGLQDAEFYWHTPDDESNYLNLTGTGNTIRVREPGVTDYILDSLRYWVTEMRVDGFRFDLAPVIGRTETDFDRRAPIFERIREDEILSSVKLIAEPWDVGPGGYQVGGFPDNWSEWNDRYRDVVRSFWRSDDHILSEMGFRLTGSADFYGARACGPCASVNFVAAHDGMTVMDLISYHAKRNFANGDNNDDGHEHDVNQFIGPDGAVDDLQISQERQQRARNLLGTLLVSRGVPMILGGDEFGRSQGGNNNAYCQDNAISWLDWTFCREHEELVRFVKDWIALRKAEPALRISKFPDDDIDEADPWVWFDESGALMTKAEWDNSERRSFGIYLDAAEESGFSRLALLFNAGGDELIFKLPEDVVADNTAVVLMLTTVPGERDPLVAPPSSLSVIGLRVS
jgi:glycogen operon protein